MKISNTILTLILVLFTSSLLGQEFYNSLYQKRRVKSVRTSDGFTHYYNKEGRLIRMKYKTKDDNGDKYKGTIYYHYDQEGDIIRIEGIGYAKENDSTYCDSSIEVYIYSNLKKEVKRVDYNNGIRRQDTLEYWVYDDQKNLILRERYGEKSHEKTIYRYGQDSLPDTIWYYNNKQWIGEMNMIFTDSIGLRKGTAFKYDKNKRLISENQFIPLVHGQQLLVNYEYDDNGKLLIKKNYKGAAVYSSSDTCKAIEITNYKYHNGLLIEEVKEINSCGKTNMSDLIRYKYNKKGLLKRKTLIAIGYDNKTLKIVERNHYHYYWK